MAAKSFKVSVLSFVLCLCIAVTSVAAQDSDTDYRYSIDVDLTGNQVMIYKRDGNGEYTVPFKSFVCSVGEGTPEGRFNTTDKYDWRALFGNVYGQYATRITGSILFPSVPYTSTDKSTLEYDEYNKLGQTASMGCIRLSVKDAKWIYDNCPSGTSVNMFRNGEPMPLAKPEPIKIDVNDTKRRGWDPTDPDINNPWNVNAADKPQDSPAEQAEAEETEETAVSERKVSKRVAESTDVVIVNNTKVQEKEETIPDYNIKRIGVYSGNAYFMADAIDIEGAYYVSLPEIIDFLGEAGRNIQTPNVKGEGYIVMLDNTCSVTDSEFKKIIAENNSRDKKSVLLCFNGGKIKTPVYQYEGKNMFNIGIICSMAGLAINSDGQKLTIGDYTGI